MTVAPDDAVLREVVPAVLGVLVRRGADFATAEDAVQEALIEAVVRWKSEPPNDAKAWLVTVAWRKFLDLTRSEVARLGREERLLAQPESGPTENADDTLALYFLCAHPSLPHTSAVALTLRAVGGLTTRQIAAAYLVPEATMAQRISRAKRTVADGRLVPLASQDRTRWRTDLVAEGVDLLQAALVRDALGRPYQAQAAIAALHADARTVAETDWVQIVEWYDELLALTDSPVVRLNRAVAMGQADGPRAGLAALADVEDTVPRHAAAAAFLHERDGDLATAATLYAEAAAAAQNLAERDHLTREAARLRQLLRGR